MQHVLNSGVDGRQSRSNRFLFGLVWFGAGDGKFNGPGTMVRVSTQVCIPSILTTSGQLSTVQASGNKSRSRKASQFFRGEAARDQESKLNLKYFHYNPQTPSL